jgi:hypothetical protein
MSTVKRLFTTKDTKGTKFGVKTSDTFVSFVIFVVREIFHAAS